MAMMVEGTRPYDDRWGDANDVFEALHLNEHELKAATAQGWIRCIQPSWIDDEHRAQPLYCFEDIHRYYEQVCHQVTKTYVKKFWTSKMIADARARIPARANAL